MTESERSSAIDRIAANVAIHDRLGGKYDHRHPEIFNPVEQARLASALGRAVKLIAKRDTIPRALDFGAGSGNLTGHLLSLGCDVTASDVSSRFLRLITRKFAGHSIRTSQLNGRDLAQFSDRSFDLVATYSVLHHIPDYLAAVAELGRVCAVGGIVYVDHELDASYWSDATAHAQYQRKVARADWRKFLRPANYYGKVRRVFDPRYANEGDIHVWPDDHIEWDRVTAALGPDFKIVIDERYLLFSDAYRPEVYEQYRDRLTDMRVMAFQRFR